jgi:hypothetical protein
MISDDISSTSAGISLQSVVASAADYEARRLLHPTALALLMRRLV